MILYHYATWRGAETHESGILKPSDRYLKGGPKLVWLTSNPEWESCLQARNVDYTRGPSAPDYIVDKDIPCWRFEVEVAHLAKLHYTVSGWVPMLEDGTALGSDIKQWHWSTKELAIIKSYRWQDNNWKEVE